MTSTLLPGDYLSPGESLVSDNGEYSLNFQHDGNLCIYYVKDGAHNAVWCTMTDGKGSAKAVLESTSNFVIYDEAGAEVWSSGSLGKAYNPALIMQNDGNLVIYATPAVWATGTNGKT